jgi:hypothetical protein
MWFSVLTINPICLKKQMEIARHCQPPQSLIFRTSQMQNNIFSKINFKNIFQGKHIAYKAQVVI